VVIVSLAGETDPRCDRELAAAGGSWAVRPRRGKTRQDS
jgi:hypothetical protein